MVAISPEQPNHLDEFHTAKGLGFDLLHDRDGVVADRYGLNFTLPEDLQAVYAGFGLDLPALNGDGHWQLPMPARYIVDEGGKIRYARVHADYTRRPEPEETLAVLRTLSEASE